MLGNLDRKRRQGESSVVVSTIDTKLSEQNAWEEVGL
jgi:hypothetical protein